MQNKKLTTLIASCLAACSSPSEVGAEPAQAVREFGEAAGDALMMPVARAAHSAVALEDGRVLLIGGCVAESCERGPDSSTVDVFDPNTNQFDRAGTLLSPRVSTTTAALGGGRVLIAGGWVGSTVTNSTELFEARAGRSRSGPNLSSPRADMAVVVLRDGRVLLAGGFDGGRAVDDIDVFDPSDGSLREIGTLSIARTGAGAASLPDGRVLVVGGGVNGVTGLRATATAEIIDPGSGKSRMTGSLREARYKHAVAALKDGRVLALGGSDERDSRGKLDTIESYDPASGRFTPAGRMFAKRYKIGSAVALLGDGRLLIGGGAPRAELYDPATAQLVELGPPLGGSLNFATATLLTGGGVLIAGGYYEDGIRMSRGAWLLQ